MLVDMNKYDLINMLKGCSMSYQQCEKQTTAGLMKFSGNQHNEDWDWIVEKLMMKSEEELLKLYQECLA